MLASAGFRIVGTLGESGLPNNETILTSTHYRMQPGFLAAAVTHMPGAIPSQIYLPLLRLPPSALAAPSLDAISPPADNPTFPVRWSAVSGALSYVLERAASPDFWDAVQVYAGTATEHIAASAGIATYHYRVKARNATGDSGWSNAQSVPVRWEQ